MLGVDPHERGEFEVALLLDDSGRIVDHDVGFRPFAPDRIRALVRRVCDRGATPPALRVNRTSVVDAIHDVVPDLDVAVVRSNDELDVLQASLRAFARQVGHRLGGSTPTGVAAASAELLAASERFARARPWQWLSDSDAMTVTFDDLDASHTTWVVLGAAGETFGLMGYRSPDALQAFQDALREVGRPLPDPVDQLGLIYSAPDELPAAVADAFAERGYGCPDLLPLATRVRRLDGPGTPVDDLTESLTLAAAMEALATFFERHLMACIDTRHPVDFAIETSIGGTAKVTWHGDSPFSSSARSVVDPSLDPVQLFEQIDLVATRLVQDALPQWPHAIQIQEAPSDFLIACDDASEHPADHRLALTGAAMPVLVVRSSRADARRATRELIDAMAIVAHAPSVPGAPSALSCERANGEPILLAPVTPGPEALRDFEARIHKAGGELVLLIMGGGLRRQQQVLKAQDCVMARRVAWRSVASPWPI